MPLLTPEKAAEELGISGRQLRDLSADGKIPFIDVGRGGRPARRYDPADIQAFISERRTISCPSSNAPAPKRTATTSASKVFDIQAILAARTREKPSDSKKNSGRRPRPV
jgi:excisionase family DNA binding protein